MQISVAHVQGLATKVVHSVWITKIKIILTRFFNHNVTYSTTRIMGKTLLELRICRNAVTQEKRVFVKVKRRSLIKNKNKSYYIIAYVIYLLHVKRHHRAFRKDSITGKRAVLKQDWNFISTV